jgi:hypothetical protein
LRIKSMRNNQTSNISIASSESKGLSRKKITTQVTTTAPDIEILVEGEECPYCHFAKLKKEEDQIVCPVCGYGRKVCT